MDRTERSALAHAQAILKDKDNRILSLELTNKDIQKKLECEMIHSEHVNDINIDLKEQIERLKDRLKVRVLPSALDHQNQKIQTLHKENQMLRRCLVKALEMIPDTAVNKSDKQELLDFYGKIA